MNEPKKNILILVNKKFEYEGFEAGFCEVLNKIKDASGGDFSHFNVSVCCIEKKLFEKDPNNSSNSQEKHKRLVDHLKGQNAPDYIFSVSTSESTYEGQGDKPTNDGDCTASANGCVYVGGRYFMADCRAINRNGEPSHLKVGTTGNENTQYYPLQDGVAELLVKLNDSKLVAEISTSLQTVPSYPAKPLRYLSDPKMCCVGVVNVTNYDQYPIADGCAYGLFYKEAAKGNADGTPICIETTHGVVRMAAGDAYGKNTPPVIFVSPITDRFVRFDKDVTSTKDKEKFDNQNYACSYNSGIAVAHMMKFLDNKLEV